MYKCNFLVSLQYVTLPFHSIDLEANIYIYGNYIHMNLKIMLLLYPMNLNPNQIF